MIEHQREMKTDLLRDRIGDDLFQLAVYPPDDNAVLVRTVLDACRATFEPDGMTIDKLPDIGHKKLSRRIEPDTSTLFPEEIGLDQAADRLYGLTYELQGSKPSRARDDWPVERCVITDESDGYVEQIALFAQLICPDDAPDGRAPLLGPLYESSSRYVRPNRIAAGLLARKRIGNKALKDLRSQ